MSTTLIPPHGGELVQRLVSDDEREGWLSRIHDAPRLEMNTRQLADVECIATGVYSPLTGFMGREAWQSVVETMRLPDGVVWPIPITLRVDETTRQRMGAADLLVLTHKQEPLAVLEIQEIYRPNTEEEARQVYRTTDLEHPGVRALYEAGPWAVAGPLHLLSPIPHTTFTRYRFTPAQTREIFRSRGWKTVVAFQTRNPIHRAHEYLQKVALEMVDGLFVNPLVGATKADDVPAEVRMHTYEVILREYYPQDRVFLGVFPAAMRYAGPREAVLHAIARKNYGCTHFIVGRDHAGVGNYYGTYDAQKIFDEFKDGELGIQPLKFEHAFFCKKCGQMATRKTCPHDAEHHVFLSGTRVRAMLREGQLPPPEFTRPEVAKILLEAYQPSKG